MNTPKPTRILIMAGGTGGHVMPALAVARVLRARGAEVRWLGTRRGLESTLVAQAGFDIAYIAVSGLRGKGVLSWVMAPFKLSIALTQALLVVKRLRPSAVLGMGGFVTGPGGLASWLLRRPLVVHEQNAIAGLTNRLLAPLAKRVMAAFPATFGPRPEVEVTGNPVRAEITRLASPETRYTAREGRLRVLVIGGSLGARALNELVPTALARLEPEVRPEVWHQSGKALNEQTRTAYAAAGLSAHVEPFIEDMAEAYAWADLVICRAGALTVSELAAAGVAALLVPYPYAVDDHQTVNARFLAEAGAAWLIQQKDLTADRLANLLRESASAEGHARLLDMARAGRALARPQAAERVAERCLEVAHG
ncbi:MAG TPA: undecaprenyldiphospho-muramoylpentapeptide beta-N-acetylglucosaminyltransferase [Gammaproteobacteria bacterium]|nr:undecaprenyldiphospho-muramoylpentapeptide beta-N-acetylglucosaminyltransferase [Gammaproteobacteria bacterium]